MCHFTRAAIINLSSSFSVTKFVSFCLFMYHLTFNTWKNFFFCLICKVFPCLAAGVEWAQSQLGLHAEPAVRASCGAGRGGLPYVGEWGAGN